MIYQGYFLCEYEDIEHEQTYKEITGTTEVNVYEEDKVIGVKDVPVYEDKVDTWTTTRPKLGQDVKNHISVGEKDNNNIIYIITQDKEEFNTLAERSEYLGSSIKDVVEKSFKDATLISVARKLLYSTWYTGELDEDKNKIIKRGNIQEWIDAGKPKLLNDWVPKTVYAGVKVEMPTVNEEVDQIQQLIDLKE